MRQNSFLFVAHQLKKLLKSFFILLLNFPLKTDFFVSRHDEGIVRNNLQKIIINRINYLFLTLLAWIYAKQKIGSVHLM